MNLIILFLYFIIQNANSLPVKLENIAMPDYSDLVQAVMPAVVNIVAFKSHKSMRTTDQNVGSGFIISADGQMVTNYHIIEECNNIKITTSNNKEYEAEIIGFDKITDLALLKIKSDDVFVYVEMSPEFKIGQGVLIIGSPFGLGNSVATGIVSGKSRFIGENSEEFIQTDAPINEGNSGGPWFNSLGKVIGITSRIVESKTGLRNIGIGLATPANIAINTIENIKKYKKVIRPWIGVSYVAVDKEIALAIGLKLVSGVLIHKVIPNSPAEKAGIKEGDVLLKIDNNQLTNSVLLSEVISKMPVEIPINIEILRSNNKIQTSLILKEKKDEKTAIDDWLFGIEISGIPREVNYKLKLSSDFKGIFVTKITNKEIIKSNKLKSGNIVTKVNDVKINNVLDFKNVMRSIKNTKKQIALFYLYGKNGESRAVAISLE